MDLAALIESFATGTYTVVRRAPGGFLKGVANATVDANITIRASLQPATGKDLLRLPELRRSNETRVLFTTTVMYTGDEGDPQEADIVIVNGERWEVQTVETWIHSGADVTAYRVIVQAPTDGDG